MTGLDASKMMEYLTQEIDIKEISWRVSMIWIKKERGLYGFGEVGQAEQGSHRSSLAQTQKVWAQCYRAGARTKHLVPPVVVALACRILFRQPVTHSANTL
jgi:hypothetical protein